MKTSTPLILAAALAMGMGSAFAQSAPGGPPANPKASPAPMPRDPGGTATTPHTTGPAAPAVTQPKPSTAPNPPPIATTPPAPAPAAGMPASGVISTRAEAYNRLEQQGYRDIQNLALGTDGNWHGKAIRGAVHVSVVVTPQGMISAN